LEKAKQMNNQILKLILIALVALTILIPGCSRAGSALNGSGKIIDHDLTVTDFNSVNIKGVFEVEISRAEDFKVTLSTDENLLGRIQVSVEHKTLKLGIAAPATFLPTSLKVKIGMPEMVGLNLSGGAKGVLQGFESDEHLSVFLAGGSTLNGYLKAGQITFNLSDASLIGLKGIATYLELECKGASKADLGDLTLTAAQVKLSEASEATLNINGRFDANLSDASKVFYLGNPLFTNTSISGGSTMVHK
jgi:hypothetical protein